MRSKKSEGHRTRGNNTYMIASRVKRIATQAAARTTHWGICAVTIGNEDVHTDLIVLANHACSTVDLVVVD